MFSVMILLSRKSYELGTCRFIRDLQCPFVQDKCYCATRISSAHTSLTDYSPRQSDDSRAAWLFPDRFEPVSARVIQDILSVIYGVCQAEDWALLLTGRAGEEDICTRSQQGGYYAPSVRSS